MAKTDIWTLIRKRFPAPEYALMAEVRNAAGYSASRSADGIAMNLWPSRGLAINGIEVKVSRYDWLRELKKPDKAEAVFQYCDYWWLITGDETVAKLEEIPDTWGWLAVKGERMKLMKEAVKLTPLPLDKGFVSSMVRRVTEGMIPVSTIADKIAEAKEIQKIQSDRFADHLQSELDGLKKQLKEFEDISGITINRWSMGNIGGAVNLIARGGTQKIEYELQSLRRSAQGILDSIDSYLPKEEKDIALPDVQLG